jgi:2-polyprenyl-3-methyl-5-hydroxy-6-metoxy-1,4-benzoquinol methylase
MQEMSNKRKDKEWKILGGSIEEFLINWNKITFQLGGLSEFRAEKLSSLYLGELKITLNALGIDLQEFFINLSRGGSISTVKVADATSKSKIEDFYRHNLWGISIPYTLPIVLDMEPNFKGKTILDIGCGFGRLSLLCALKGAKQVVAIDLSDPLIQSLERTISLLKLSNIETHRMDAENLEFKSNTFDIVYCCEVIEHLPSPKKALSAIKSVLKPDGVLLLSTPNGLNIAGFKQAFFKLFHYNWISPYGAGQPELHMYNPITLRNLLSNCGFRITSFRGSEYLDNLALLYPGNLAIGITQFLPLIVPFFQKIKSGIVGLGKSRFLKYFGLELFIRAIPDNKQQDNSLFK